MQESLEFIKRAGKFKYTALNGEEFVFHHIPIRRNNTWIRFIKHDGDLYQKEFEDLEKAIDFIVMKELGYRDYPTDEFGKYYPDDMAFIKKVVVTKIENSITI